MNAGQCEVCGSPLAVHTIGLVADSSQRTDHHYCLEHAPAALGTNPKLTALLEEKIAKIDELPVSDEEKKNMRAMLREMLRGK
jgi:hypothetical protein